MTDYGQDPTTQKWFSPQQRAWGLQPHQKVTPGLAAKLCFTALATTSYESAAAVAAQWGVTVTDSLMHQQVQRAGERAQRIFVLPRLALIMVSMTICHVRFAPFNLLSNK